MVLISIVRLYTTGSDELADWRGLVRVHAVDREASFEMLGFLRGGEDH